MERNRAGKGNKGTMLLLTLCCMALLAAAVRGGAEAFAAGERAGNGSAVMNQYSGEPRTVQGYAAGSTADGYSSDGHSSGSGKEPSRPATGTAGTPSAAVALISELGRAAAGDEEAQRVVFKWQGGFSVSAAGASAHASAAAALAAKLGLPDPAESEEEGHKAYRSSSRDRDIRTSMFVADMGNGDSYAIVTLETGNLQAADGFSEAAERAGAELAASGIGADWNVSLQCAVKGNTDAARTLKEAEAAMDGKLQGMTAAETYGDATTASMSYTVPSIRHTLQSGNHALALQAAVHNDEAAGNTRITIGLPLITIEY